MPCWRHSIIFAAASWLFISGSSLISLAEREPLLLGSCSASSPSSTAHFSSIGWLRKKASIPGTCSSAYLNVPSFLCSGYILVNLIVGWEPLHTELMKRPAHNFVMWKFFFHHRYIQLFLNESTAQPHSICGQYQYQSICQPGLRIFLLAQLVRGHVSKKTKHISELADMGPGSFFFPL